jgi:hypothetical protein
MERQGKPNKRKKEQKAHETNKEKKLTILKANLVSYPITESIVGEREGNRRARSDNQKIENLPETQEVIEPTPLELYCPQIAGSKYPPRTKSPWTDGMEPVGQYHPIYTCARHQITDVLQVEEEFLIRNPASCKVARGLNSALRSAMLQKQKLSTDQMSRQMTGWINEAQEEILRTDVTAPEDPKNLRPFGEIYRMVWGSRSHKGWNKYHTLSPIVANLTSDDTDGYGHFHIGHGEIFSRTMKPRRRDCPIPLVIGIIQQMLAEASDEAHASDSPVKDVGMEPRDLIIEELATTDNFHVVSYQTKINERLVYNISKPVTRVIQNGDNTFRMRIDLFVSIMTCERLPDPVQDEDGNYYDRVYEPTIDGPLDDDQIGNNIIENSLGFAIHIEISNLSPRAGKSKFYSQNDYALYAWEGFYNDQDNASRIIKVIEQRPMEQRSGVLRWMMHNYHVQKFLREESNHTLRYAITRFLMTDYGHGIDHDKLVGIPKYELFGWRRLPHARWDSTAAWEQSVGNIDSSLMGPYSHTQTYRDDEDAYSANTIHSWEYMYNEVEPGDEDMIRRFREDGDGRHHRHGVLMDFGLQLERPPAGPIRIRWGTTTWDDDVSQRQGGKLLEYQPTPLYLQMYGNKPSMTEGPMDKDFELIGLETIPGNDKIIKQFIRKVIPANDIKLYHFNKTIQAHYKKGPTPIKTL